MNDASQAWVSAAITDVGRVRRLNEDAILDRPDRGLWVVADGMGGHEAGDVASSTIVNLLDKIAPPQDFSRHVDAVRSLILEANEALLRYSAEHLDHRIVGSTVAAFVTWGNSAAVLWVGDSRVYRLREEVFQQISKDHTEVQNLVDLGEITVDEMEVHPSKNILTRAVGVDPMMEVEQRLLDVKPGDRFLLCSDGLTKELSDQQIGQCVEKNDSSVAVEKLREMSLMRGGRDNVSIIAVSVSQAAFPAEQPPRG